MEKAETQTAPPEMGVGENSSGLWTVSETMDIPPPLLFTAAKVFALGCLFPKQDERRRVQQVPLDKPVGGK